MGNEEKKKAGESLVKKIGRGLPLTAILKILIGYISDIVDLVSPDDLTSEETERLQSWVGSLYGLAKFAGKKLVLSTENDLDDSILKEAIEVCEKAAEKYGFTINPLEIPFP